MSNNLKFVSAAQSAEYKISGMIGRSLKANDFANGDIQGRHKASQSKPFSMYYCSSEATLWQKNINVRDLPALPSRASFETNGFFWPVSAGDKSLKVSAPAYEAYKSFVHVANGLVAWLASNNEAEFHGSQLFANAEFRALVQAFAAKDKACHKSFKLPVEFGKNGVSYSFANALRDLVACSAILEPIFADSVKTRTTVDISTKYRVSAAWRDIIASLKHTYGAYLA